MIITSAPAEQRTVLPNISWETLEALLRETGADRGWRFAYDGSTLELMTTLFEHENPKIQFDRLIFALAEELDIEIKSAGSTTLKRQIANRGIEPDNCYYIQNELAVRGKQKLNLETDPPPDLAIEIDITSKSEIKKNSYEALGVPELWIYDGRSLQINVLQNRQYVATNRSQIFPVSIVEAIPQYVMQSKVDGRNAAIKAFRFWVAAKL